VIVLDTSVISELTRPVPEPGIILWLGSLPAGQVGTTAVTAAELLCGAARMPGGRRKTELTAAVRGLLGEDFRGRVLPFDEHCASRYAGIVCGRETLGRPIAVADAQIAAICRTAEATLATRSTDDFSGTGIELINPWKPDRPEPA
jgi:toxin FitB